jgi:hypothetical protein
MMLDVSYSDDIMLFIGREDKALQRCTLSARSMPGDGQEHWLGPVLLPSPPSSGLKAKNLLSWGKAPSLSTKPEFTLQRGHMSRFNRDPSLILRRYLACGAGSGVLLFQMSRAICQLSPGFRW